MSHTQHIHTMTFIKMGIPSLAVTPLNPTPPSYSGILGYLILT